MANYALAFAELLAGAILLDYGVKGAHTALSQAPAAGGTGGSVPTGAPAAGGAYPGVPAPEAGQYVTSGPQGPSGLATFDGIQVAAWILPELQYARAHGWTGTITSGYRAEGGSEHSLTQYPGGAVDFGGPGGPGSSGWVARADFFLHTIGYTGLKLIPAQFGPYSAYPQGDGGHASGNGH